MNGADNHTCAHVRESSPPIIQNTISCVTCHVTMLIERSRLESAVRNAPTAMPARRSVETGVVPPRVAIVDEQQREERRNNGCDRQRNERGQAPPRNEHRNCAEDRSRPDPDEGWLAQRISEQALHHRAGCREGRADARGDEHAGVGSATRSLRRRVTEMPAVQLAGSVFTANASMTTDQSSCVLPTAAIALATKWCYDGVEAAGEAS